MSAPLHFNALSGFNLNITDFFGSAGPLRLSVTPPPRFSETPPQAAEAGGSGTHAEITTAAWT